MKKTIISVSTAILLTTSVFSGSFLNSSSTVYAAEQVVAHGEVVSAVNFRTAPSTKSRVMTVLQRGTKFEVLEIVNSNWLKVKVRNTTGYVSASSKYVKRVKSSSSNDSKNVSSRAELADKIIDKGLTYRGTPYKFGAKSGQTKTFDCSSFTQYLYGLYGVKLPRNSRQQAEVGKSVSASELQKGDLIFFKTGNRKDGKIDHVAIYMGDNKILHTIPSGGVQVSKFSGFWKKTAVSAKRVL